MFSMLKEYLTCQTAGVLRNSRAKLIRSAPYIGTLSIGVFGHFEQAISHCGVNSIDGRRDRGIYLRDLEQTQIVFEAFLFIECVVVVIVHSVVRKEELLLFTVLVYRRTSNPRLGDSFNMSMMLSRLCKTTLLKEWLVPSLLRPVAMPATYFSTM